MQSRARSDPVFPKLHPAAIRKAGSDRAPDRAADNQDDQDQHRSARKRHDNPRKRARGEHYITAPGTQSLARFDSYQAPDNRQILVYDKLSILWRRTNQSDILSQKSQLRANFVAPDSRRVDIQPSGSQGAPTAPWFTLPSPIYAALLLVMTEGRENRAYAPASGLHRPALISRPARCR